MRLWLISLHLLCFLAYSEPAPVVIVGTGTALYICSESIIRVRHTPEEQPVHAAGLNWSLVVRADWPPVKYSTTETDQDVIVTTSVLRITASKSTGRVRFGSLDTPERTVLQERSHSLTPSSDMGKKTYVVEQTWEQSSPGEALYGGGSFQQGFVNFQNAPMQLLQYNTEDAVPFFVSSEGYGILWDNYAWSYLNPPDETELLLQHAVDSGVQKGTFTSGVAGDYYFHVGEGFPVHGDEPSWGFAASVVKVSIWQPGTQGQNQTVIEWVTNKSIPSALTGRVRLVANTSFIVQLETDAYFPTTKLYVRSPDYARICLRSFIGDHVDYYFMFGQTVDGSIRSYREATGPASLYAKWVYGFWQSRNHYKTQNEVVDAAKGFRNRSIPLDAIVQDWRYWGSKGWGPHWDPSIYPDPAKMVQDLASINVKLMVSVWSKFGNTTSYFKQMQKAGYNFNTAESCDEENCTYYDPWNPDARELYYQFSKSLFDIGVEALWMDGTEPDNLQNVDQQTHLGSGNALLNTYSLMTTRAIADGLRRDFPTRQGRRVFTLTRSSFAGQQTTGAMIWTGDTLGTWGFLKQQIAGAINYQLSGIPYWGQDIGGFHRPTDQHTNPDYQTLLTRWFQFGVFTPLFRVHGGETELWLYGETVQSNIVESSVNLRYRLLPYIYSNFWRADVNGYTVLRGLVFDFADDLPARNVDDQFMWGDAFLVCPFVTPDDTRQVYLPLSVGGWYNFHNGSVIGIHGRVIFQASIAQAPVLVRAGSIVCLGPIMNHTLEKPTDPIEIRVYPGADGRFTLYEDDGVTNSQEVADAGQFVRIEFSWDDQLGELSISSLQGQGYAGMPQSRKFLIVFVSMGHGVGVQETSRPDVVVTYDGKAEVIRRPTHNSVVI